MQRVQLTIRNQPIKEYSNVANVGYLANFVVIRIIYEDGKVVDKSWPAKDIISISTLVQPARDVPPLSDSKYDRRVVQLDKDGTAVTHNSVREAVEALNWDTSTAGNILEVCRGNLDNVKGVVFEYVEEQGEQTCV